MVRKYSPILLGLLLLIGGAVAGDRYVGEMTRASDINSGSATSGQALLANGSGGSAFGDVGSASDVSAIKAAPILTDRATSAFSGEVSLGALTTGMLKHTVSGSVSTPATAVEGTDYWKPGGTDVAIADGGTGNSAGAGADSIAWTSVSTNITLTAGLNYLTSGSTTLEETLPTVPSAGNEVVTNRASIAPVYIEPGSANVNGTACILVNIPFGITRWRYIDSTTGWATSGAVGCLVSANLTQYVSAHSGITDTSGLVSAWNDLSGNGYNYAAAGGNRPTLRAEGSGIGNHPAVDYDGTDDQMTTADGAQWNYTNQTVVIVFQPDLETGNQNLINHYSGTSGFTVTFGTTTSRKFRFADTSGRENTGVNTATRQAFALMVTRDPTISFTRFSFACQGAGFRLDSELGYAAMTDPAVPLVLGDGQTPGGAPSNGKFGMMAMWSDQKGPQDQALIRNYIANAFGF